MLNTEEMEQDISIPLDAVDDRMEKDWPYQHHFLKKNNLL